MFEDFLSFKPLLSKVEYLLDKLNCRGSRVIVAVSGGADSIALLYCLFYFKDKYSLNISAVHVNHGLRGTESDTDAKFVSEICNSLSLKCYVEKINNLQDLNGSIENNARIARYGVFNKVIDNTKAEYLFLAHHAMDQAETILMNVFRGCGTDSLQGMKSVSNIYGVKLVRPFLNITKDQIINALLANHISYRIDKSNLSNEYRRNAIRLDIIPKILDLYPNGIEAIVRLSELSAIDSNYFDNITNDIIIKNSIVNDKFCIILKSAFLKLDKSIAFRLIRKMYSIARNKFLGVGYIEDDERTLSYKSTLESYQLINSNLIGKIELNRGIFLSASYKYIHFYVSENNPSTKCINFSNNFDKLNFDGISLIKQDQDLRLDGKFNQAIPNKLLDKAVIRYRTSGDRIRPYGHTGSQSLKKYLINKKIDAEFRNVIPVIAIDSEILWVIGVGASNLLKVDYSKDDYCIYKINSILPWARKDY